MNIVGIAEHQKKNCPVIFSSAKLLGYTIKIERKYHYHTTPKGDKHLRVTDPLPMAM